MLTLVCFISCLAAVQAAVPSFGACPNVRGMTNFNKNSYLGVWYEYSNVFEIFQIGSSCVRATYTDLGTNVGVLNEQVNDLTGYGNITGTARPAALSGEFIVGFSSVPFASGGTEPNYRVVDTDYTSYAVVYSCSPFFFFMKKESLWLLTRQQTPQQYVVDVGYSKMRALGLPVAALEKTPQTNCIRLPLPSTTTATAGK
ncbi:apolipoprotein D [Eurytemora carolleeae]|uniref:apolipoprotein D n=1 Tax=Eurytemora carolleeae TaxID=1294199 RepID=UPI000C7645CE|nr:apolipoprotein D [Eurytemora carolleeae]|eukprot:XP_023338682.1 apolipoprotein D-like [Eurytemora affinis]